MFSHFHFLFKNIGEVKSHEVYPRASKVEREPPFGNEDASGSPWINWKQRASLLAYHLQYLKKRHVFQQLNPSKVGTNG
jgi:hypothetical protein